MRSHIAEHQVIAQHCFSSCVLTEPFGRKRSADHRTEVILSITNWWFVKNHQNDFRPVSVGLKDLHVSLKLSSTVFKSPDSTSDSGLYFDKNGWIVPYPALIGLLNDSDFADFLGKAYRKFRSELDGDLNAEDCSDAATAAAADADDDDDKIGERRKKKPRVLSDDDDDDTADNDDFNDSGICHLTTSELDELEREAADAGAACSTQHKQGKNKIHTKCVRLSKPSSLATKFSYI